MCQELERPGAFLTLTSHCGSEDGGEEADDGFEGALRGRALFPFGECHFLAAFDVAEEDLAHPGVEIG